MKKMNFRWLFYPFLMFLLGINVVRYIFNGSVEYIIITSLILILFSLYSIINKHLKQMLALIFSFILGCSWYFVGIESFKATEYVGKAVVVGRITDSISEEKYSYSVILDSVEINGKNEGNVCVEITNCALLPEIGSFISFESELENVRPFTLGDFNTSAYRSGVRYNATCNFKNVVVTEGYKTFDEIVRLSIKDKLYENMSPDNAETAFASLFGDKNNLDSDIYSAYKGAGIIHILTVSGLHVSFLISLIFGLMKKCSINKYVNFVLTAGFILFYAYLCNFTPSVLRAGIMGIIFMLSKLLYRKYDSLNALGVAGFLICLCSPLSGVDFGFLMSVFCVIGINVIMPVVQKLLSKIMPKQVYDVFAVGIAAQIGILPLLCLMGGEINLLSIFANFFVVPLFGVVYPFLFAVSFLSLLIPFLAKLLIVADFAFTLIFMIAQFFNVEQSKIYIKNMGYVNILLFYVASFIISDYLVMLGKEKVVAITVVMLCFACSTLGYYFKTDTLSTISYISQYNQSSVVLKNSSGEILAVGDCYLLGKLMDKTNSTCDIFVANDRVNSYRYDALQDLISSCFLSFEDGAYDENIVCEFNKDYMLGGFKLTYCLVEEKFVGTRVVFDENEVFIASGNNNCYNEFRKLNNTYKFDFVFADYSLGDGDFVHIANKYVVGCNYSFNALGNFAFDGKNLSFRSLD